MRPPAAALHAQAPDVASDDAVEHIDEGSERTEIAAEPSGEYEADDENRRCPRKRPHPGPRGDSSRDAHERVEGEKCFDPKQLLRGKILHVV